MTEIIGVKLSEQSVDFLKDELNRLQALYTQEQNNAQGVFNFYLTFISAVIGGLIFIVQITPAGNLLQTQLIAGGLLLFTALVGVVYLAAISGRYAHAARYAAAVDALRLHLMQRLEVPMPELYRQFLDTPKSAKPTPAKRMLSWGVWLFPTGTYELFIAIVNSLALAAFTTLIGGIAQLAIEALIGASVVVFLITFMLYNAYSTLAMRMFRRRLHVRIDTSHELSIWAGRN
jgi:hypothetical protein